MLASAADIRTVTVEIRAETLRVYRVGKTLSYLCVGLITRQSSVGFQADSGCDGQICLVYGLVDRVDGVIL